MSLTEKRCQMSENFNKAKEVSIESYLKLRGYSPKKESAKWLHYLSPFGNETNPSFVVNKYTNRFKDYSADKSGSVIDLCMELERVPAGAAVDILLKRTTQAKARKFEEIPKEKQKPPIIIVREGDIVSETLINYFRNVRKIDIDLLRMYCCQVEFLMMMKTGKYKRQKAIGFKNILGGYELRNNWYKGSSAPKAWSRVGDKTDIVNVFEGFVDFLTAMMYLRTDKLLNESYIMNTTSFHMQLMDIWQNYKGVNMFVDNDPTGDKVFYRMLARHHGVNEMRKIYTGFNDFNEFWVNG